MENKIILPKGIESKISYVGWEALSWILNNGWVQDYKYLFSEKKGYDVGTPFTVEAIMCLPPLDKGKARSPGMAYRFFQKSEKIDLKELKRLMIAGYLLGTDFVTESLPPIPDEHGVNQLEGELRRYWARKKEISEPGKIELNPEIVEDYCAAFGLEEARERFAGKLGL